MLPSASLSTKSPGETARSSSWLERLKATDWAPRAPASTTTTTTDLAADGMVQDVAASSLTGVSAV